MVTFLIAILALIIVGLLRGMPAMAATATLLLANFVAANAFFYITADAHAWLLYLVIDYLCALGVLIYRQAKWPIAVAAIYAVQILCHAGYGLSPQGPWESYNYWWIMYYTGWGQLVVMGSWAVYELAGGFWGDARRDRRSPSGGTLLEGVDE